MFLGETIGFPHLRMFIYVHITYVYPRLTTLLNFIKSWGFWMFLGWGAKELSLVRRLGRVALPHIPAADGVHQGAGGNGCGAHHAWWREGLSPCQAWKNMRQLGSWLEALTVHKIMICVVYVILMNHRHLSPRNKCSYINHDWSVSICSVPILLAWKSSTTVPVEV